MLCFLHYGWALESFTLNLVQLSSSFFKLWYQDSLSDMEINTAMSQLELIFIREGQFTLPGFAKSQFTALATTQYCDD